ncbi:MAG TPA: 3-mercaptopyruvate sulfurtransferase [Gemmatimonadales bacterium]
MTPIPPLVSTEWLAGRLGDPSLRVLDASWYLPTSGRDARREYLDGHLPGAVFMDLDAVSDTTSDLPHMLPAPDDFARHAGALGVGDGTTVVVYDGSGTNLSAPRAWWMFRVFGHDRVAVLDGGMKLWRAEGRPLEGGEVAPEPAHFTPRIAPALVRDMSAVRDAVRSGDAQVVDMRPAGRFEGRDPEPRPGLRSGSIPGSVNVPFTTLTRADGTALPPDELRRHLADAGVRLDHPVIASCGSGTSACSLLLNLERLGKHDWSLYDGSWAEWGREGV